MRFCPYCGAPIVPSGKFCVECGRQLERPASRGIRGLPLTAAFVGVFLAILIVGLIVVYLIVPMSPAAKIASIPPQAPSSAGGESPGAQNLPPGHPSVELPADARRFIDQTEKEAQAKPKDVAAWNRFGDVALRAAAIDPSYYPKAEDAYAHVLKIDPDSPDALRGIGNLNYDHKNYDQATAAYEHYLKQRPDDPEVRTDLGTMYLYTNNPDQAVVQYKRAIQAKPDFFEAYYNMGVAYGEQNDQANARQAFGQAMKLAPDDSARSKVQEEIGKLAGGSGAAPSVASASAAGAGAAAQSPPAQQNSAAQAPAGSFHDEIEGMMRSIPFAGPKVQSVKWIEKHKAMVMMDKFPMDQMPPFAKQKFLTDLKNGIKSAKTDHQVKAVIVVDIADAATGQVMESVSQ